MTDWLLVLAAWAIAGALWYPHVRPAPPAPEPLAPPRYTRIVADDEAWSPEGWGPPDSEVVMTAGDDYLAQMHRPIPEDET